jgi:hypothetical protein
VARNKMGGTGHSTRLRVLVDSIEPGFSAAGSEQALDEKNIVEKPALQIGSSGGHR